MSLLPENEHPKISKIFAAEKIIADISSGVYRTPAAALKELISNAYDADATRVTVNTDAPLFRTLTITDDGTGMKIDAFLDVLAHIGGSKKRFAGEITPKFKRKIIGRIGIGMLAVAQLGSRFYVSSSVEGEPTRFIAEVDLEPFHRDDAALQSMGKVDTSGKVTIGAVKYVDNLPERQEAHYTTITVQNAKKGLISEITSAVRKAVGATEEISLGLSKIVDFQQIIDAVRSAKRADLTLDGYYYMLWELGLLCPVNYCRSGPFETNSNSRQIELGGPFTVPRIDNFRVEIDDLEVQRPQLFPNTNSFDYASPNPKLYVLNYDQNIAKRRLAFAGYIYAQQPRIDPEELRGVHIRIRNVGIGVYDKTWLGYPFNEGVKFGQVTGELFVEEGLEPALNIDRDSFRETDVHYQAMRAYVWNYLRKTVFPEFKSRQNQYRQERKTVEGAAHSARFNASLSSLPAPLTSVKEVTSLKHPTISSWIGAEKDQLIVQKRSWDAFAAKMGLGGDAKARFLHVLIVLVSSELFLELEDDEVNPVLESLALAVL